MESNNDKCLMAKERRTFLYTFVVCLYAIVAKVLFFIRIEGKENIPKDRNCVMMGNHKAFWDPLSLAMCVWDREIRFMGKKELWNNKFFARLCDMVHGIPVDRGNMDMAAVRTAMNVLKDGYTLGIFPEGTRSKGDGMMPLLGGAALMALRSKCAVVPVYIDGSYKLFRPVVVRVGKPIDMDDLLAGRVTKEACDELNERVKAAFAGLSGGRSLLPVVKETEE